MTDLIAFLNARLDEDERVAMAATGQKWGQPAEQPEHWRWECTEDDEPIDVDLAIASGQEFLEHGEHFRVGLRSVEQWPSSAGSYGHLVIDGEEVRPQDGRHIARHDPARVLREVEAKRAVISVWKDWPGYDLPPGVHDGRDDSERSRDEATREALEAVVRTLATVYDDHPDYDPDWKP